VSVLSLVPLHLIEVPEHFQNLDSSFISLNAT
jgi:hypothetical protein